VLEKDKEKIVKDEEVAEEFSQYFEKMSEEFFVDSDSIHQMEKKVYKLYCEESQLNTTSVLDEDFVMFELERALHACNRSCPGPDAWLTIYNISKSPINS